MALPSFRTAETVSEFCRLWFVIAVCGDRVCELVGAGSVVAALDAFEGVFDLVYAFAFDEAGNALQVSAAAADEAHVVDLIFSVHVEDDLTGAGSFRIVSKHSF